MDISNICGSVPELPEDFDTWIRNVPLGFSKYMFTFRDKKRRRLGFCTHCEKIVDLEWKNKRTLSGEDFQNCNRKHNEKGFCPECGSTVIFKDNGRGKSKLWDFSHGILIQRIENSAIAVCRFFDFMRSYRHCDKTPVKTQVTEEYRLFLDISGHKAVMYKRDVAYGGRWTWLYYGGYEPGEAEINSDWYKLSKVNTHLNRYGYCPILGLNDFENSFGDTDFKYCCLEKYEETIGEYRNYIDYLTVFTRNPQAVEYLLKTGFSRLFRDYMRYRMQYRSRSALNFRAKTPEKLFGLSKAHIKLLRNNPEMQNCADVVYMRLLEKNNLSEKEFFYFFKNVSEYSFRYYWQQILQYTTMTKAINYLKKQPDCKDSDYADYLKDCRELGCDLSKSAVLFPQSLSAAHRRTIEIIRANQKALEKMKNKQQRIETAKKNAGLSRDIQKQYVDLCEKYEFHSNGMFVRPAKNLKEIKDEGKTQKICVGADNQTYIRNHALGVAFIMFIRKESEPEKPFYTVEITNQKSVCQVRGYQNKGQTDDVKAFVEKWKKYLSNADVKKLRKGA